jgi:hypothetical protein
MQVIKCNSSNAVRLLSAEREREVVRFARELHREGTQDGWVPDHDGHSPAGEEEARDSRRVRLAECVGRGVL